jgi:hypothetical protein
MTARLRLPLVSLLGLTTFACGGDEGRQTSAEDSGVASLSSSAGEETAGDGASSSDATADDDDGEPEGTKFDLGPIPDGAAACDTGVDSEFSYIWIANSTQGTVSKIDTVSTIEEGRFRTTATPSQEPSRTSVNQYGDVAIGHRFAAKVTKIAALPERCVDKNGNGIIETSGGAADIRGYLEDECVLWSTELPAEGNGTRAVAWEGGTIDPSTCTNTIPNPRLWVAYGANPIKVYRLDGDTGEVLDHVLVATPGFAYGGAVNGDGDFWVADRSGKTLSIVDGETLAVATYPVPGSNAYGVGMDQNGHPWFSTYSVGAGDHVYRFDPDTATFHSAGGTSGRYRGMNVDREGQAWVAGNSPCRLALFDAAAGVELDDSIALPGCVDPVGVSVDRDGYVWVVDRGASVAWKVDPSFHLIVGMVTGLVNPYTYSDMTGQGLNLVVNPPG